MCAIDCTREVRKARLVARGQPELATDDMHAWAAYLRGQAHALGLPVIDTSGLGIEQAIDALLADVTQGCQNVTSECFSDGRVLRMMMPRCRAAPG
jgi:hypothetical protein